MRAALDYIRRHEVRVMWVLTILAWSVFLSWAAARWTKHPVSSALGIAGVALDLLIGVEAMRYAIAMTPLRHLRVLRHKTKKAGAIARAPFYSAFVVSLVLFYISVAVSTPTTYPFGASCFYVGGLLLLGCCLFTTAVVAVARAPQVRRELSIPQRGLGAAWMVVLAISVFLVINGFVEMA